MTVMRLVFIPRRVIDAFRGTGARVLAGLVVLLTMQPVAATAETGQAVKSRKSKNTATSFIIGLPKKVNYRAYSLSNPSRVIVDLPAMAIDLPIESEFRKSALIGKFHYGLLKKGKARLIIETKRPVRVIATYTRTATGKGADLSLAITPKSGKRKSFKRIRSSLGGPPKNIVGRGSKPLIVIDAGHGGRDTGATKHGIREKDMVLAFAKILRDRLTKSGRYKVIMTRDTDKFVKLRRRAEIARENRADLFIAVHADYVSSRYSYVRGATFYTLRSRTAKRLARSSKRNIKVSSLVKNASRTDKGVLSILTDLETRWINGSKTRSDMFADSLREYMGDATKLKADPHRTANFAVLKSASVPSVLIELAYVSNKQDAKLLNSPKWRSKSTSALVKAVDNYFGDSTVRLPF